MLGIFWAEAWNPVLPPGLLAALRLFLLPLEWASLSGPETCLAHSSCRTHQSSGRASSGGNRLALRSRLTVYFCLRWAMGWMGSEIGCRGQNLLLILDLWGSLRSQGPQSGLCAPWPPAHLLSHPYSSRPGFPLSQLTQAPRTLFPQAGVCPPKAGTGWEVEYANEFLCDSGPSLLVPQRPMDLLHSHHFIPLP